MPRRRLAAVTVTLLAALGLGSCLQGPQQAPPGMSDRRLDPVVMTGADVAAFLGVPIGQIVAFFYRGGAWQQVPVQVDQRKVIELNTAYNAAANTSNPVDVEVYADAGTWAGGGSGVLETIDEIAFMAADTGELAPGGAEPAGVFAGSGVPIEVTDPLDADVSYLYLFRKTGGHGPSAGKNYVTYDFSLDAGPYKANYALFDGPNPENSQVLTLSYNRRFHDRWLDDGLQVKAGGATNVDILDRHKALFAPGVCVRSEDTFDEGEGAFVANIDGPVRAIRSYVGANSGPYTQRTHIFYAQREDVVTDLRVHAISGIMDFFDYSDAARGMTYTNDLNTAGVDIDGTPDALTAGFPTWEKVDGAQGAVTHVWDLDTDIVPLSQTNFYEDDDTGPTTQCTGDADALGASGQWIDGAVPNTDPHQGAAKKLSAHRVLFYEAPGRSTADAQRHADQVASPLEATVMP